MSRRCLNLRRALAVGSLVLPFAAPGLLHAQASFPAQPNIVFILADDMGFGDASFNGQTGINTPYLTQLAQMGTVYTSMYAGGAVCTPSRSSLMTGLQGGHTPVNTNAEDKTQGLRPEDITVGEVLQDAGYHTGLFGKWGVGGAYGSSNPADTSTYITLPDSLPTRQGFDEFYGYLSQSRAHNYQVPTLWRNDANSPDTVSLESTGGVYTHDLIAQEAESFVRTRAQQSQPFYAQVSLTVPHRILDQVPDNDALHDQYDGNGWSAPVQDYAAMVSRADQTVGNILAALEDPNNDGDTSDSVMDDTLLIFASDNGTHSTDGYDPTVLDSSGGLRGWKRDLYEGGLRTPFVAVWPGQIAAGQTNTTHIGNFADLLPTAAELAGVDAPVGLDGISMVESLLGDANAPMQPTVYFETVEDSSSGNPDTRRTLRQGDWKLIERADSQYELYNIANDPGESTNLAGSQAAKVAELTALMNLEDSGKVSYHTWSNGTTGSFTDSNNWTGGNPSASGIATINNTAGGNAVATINTNAQAMGLAVSADTGTMTVQVEQDRVLTVRNGIRVAAGGHIELDYGTISTNREVDIRSGGELSGEGTIVGDVINAGDLDVRLPQSSNGPQQPVSSTVAVIDDFESGVVGNSISTLGWTVSESGSLTFTVQADPADPANHVLQSRGTPNSSFTATLPLGTGISETSNAATLFYRLRLDGNADSDRSFAGLSASPAVNTFDDMTAYAGARPSGDGFGVRDGNDTLSIGNPADDTWYNVWLVLNNVTNLYDVYINTGTSDATAGDLLGTGFEFRTTGPDGILQTLAVLGTGAQQTNGAVYFDDFRIDTENANLLYRLGPIIMPDPDPGLLIEGNFTQTSSGQLLVTLASDRASTLTVTEEAKLAGDLLVELNEGFTTLPGETFDILTASSITGSFNQTQISNVAGLAGLWLNVLTDSDSVTLEADALGGDANLDATVDVLDLSLLATNYGSAGNWSQGDYNGDGVIDVLDLSILATNYGSSVTSSSATTVPEPASIALLLTGLILVRRSHR